MKQESDIKGENDVKKKQKMYVYQRLIVFSYFDANLQLLKGSVLSKKDREALM